MFSQSQDNDKLRNYSYRLFFIRLMHYFFNETKIWQQIFIWFTVHMLSWPALDLKLLFNINCVLPLNLLLQNITKTIWCTRSLKITGYFSWNCCIISSIKPKQEKWLSFDLLVLWLKQLNVQNAEIANHSHFSLIKKNITLIKNTL